MSFEIILGLDLKDGYIRNIFPFNFLPVACAAVTFSVICLWLTLDGFETGSFVMLGWIVTCDRPFCVLISMCPDLRCANTSF